MVVAALNKRAPKIVCPLCHSDKWSLTPEGVVFLVLQSDIKKTKMVGRGLPCAPLMCNNCGNTHLINVYHIGLKEAFERVEKPEAESEQEEEKDGN